MGVFLLDDCSGTGNRLTRFLSTSARYTQSQNYSSSGKHDLTRLEELPNALLVAGSAMGTFRATESHLEVCIAQKTHCPVVLDANRITIQYVYTMKE